MAAKDWGGSVVELIDLCEYLFLKQEGTEIIISGCLYGDVFEWHADLKHPDDLQFCMQQMGHYAADPQAKMTWYHAAILSKWLRSEFYLRRSAMTKKIIADQNGVWEED